jgi:hypothetical protein
MLAVARYHQTMALFFLGEIHELHRRSRGWFEDAEEREDRFLGSWLNAQLASYWVARDRPDTVRAMCEEATRLWAMLGDTGDFMISQACSEVLAACVLSKGDGGAIDQLETAMAWFDRSPLARVPFLVAQWHSARARTALACAELLPSGRARREALLGKAERSAEIAARPLAPTGRPVALPHYQSLALLVRAGLAATRGETELALERLDRALDRMGETPSYALRSAHARRARGLLLGGEEGEALVARTEADLRRMGVEEPARHARTVVPGFAP